MLANSMDFSTEVVILKFKHLQWWNGKHNYRKGPTDRIVLQV